MIFLQSLNIVSVFFMKVFFIIFGTNMLGTVEEAETDS